MDALVRRIIPYGVAGVIPSIATMYVDYIRVGIDYVLASFFLALAFVGGLVLGVIRLASRVISLGKLGRVISGVNTYGRVLIVLGLLALFIFFPFVYLSSVQSAVNDFTKVLGVNTNVTSIYLTALAFSSIIYGAASFIRINRELISRLER